MGGPFGLPLVRFILELDFRSVCAFSFIEIHSSVTIFKENPIVSRGCGCFALFCGYFGSFCGYFLLNLSGVALIWFGVTC